ncbi:MAG: cytochrome c oxidase subunit 3, partial [Pseudomonadota bacterium]
MAEAHTKNHDYHLVEPSPWPFIGSVGAFIMAIGAIAWMKAAGGNDFTLFGMDLAGTSWMLFAVGLLVVLYVMYGWWSDTIKESQEGYHTRVVSLHLRYGMLLFIASEVMFFVAWFWAYFDAALFAGEAIQFSRVEATGGHWPPDGILTFDP